MSGPPLGGAIATQCRDVQHDGSRPHGPFWAVCSTF